MTHHQQTVVFLYSSVVRLFSIIYHLKSRPHTYSRLRLSKKLLSSLLQYRALSVLCSALAGAKSFFSFLGDGTYVLDPARGQ